MKLIKYTMNILFAIAIFVAVILSYLLLNEEEVEVDWFSVESGNTPGNIANGGIVARQGEWVFITYYRERAGIYKINIDGSGLKRLSTDHASDINVIGDWIYYSNSDDGSSIYKIRTDGTERTKLNDVSSMHLQVVGDWIYYYSIDLSIITNADDDDLLAAADFAIKSSCLCRIRTDGSEYTKVIEGSGSGFTIADSWIYYNDVGGIYKVNLSGANKIKISKNLASGLATLQVYGEWIYYKSERRLDDRIKGIYRSRTNGTEDELVVEVSVGFPDLINVFDGWIYYTDISNGNKLYKIRTNGWGKKRINDENTTSVSFDGNWVYYTDDSGFFKIRPDGTGRQVLQPFH